LDIERQVPNLVEEEGATRCRTNEPLLVGDRAGKAATAMAEQLAVR